MSISSDDLGPLGRRVGKTGGTGEVCDVPSRPGHLVKTYLPTTPVDVTGLESLIAWRRALPAGDRQLLDDFTCWPEEIVEFDDGTTGVLIRRAPNAFFHELGGESHPRELTWAFSEDACADNALEPASPATVVALLRQIAACLDMLHRNGAAYGDISGANILWSGGRPPRVFVIDCDAAWVVGAPRALPEGQTLLWDCPWLGVEGMARDAFKFAVLVLRLYWRWQGPVDSTTQAIAMPAFPPVSPEVRELLAEGLREHGRRPTPGEWLEPLSRLEQGLRLRRIR